MDFVFSRSCFFVLFLSFLGLVLVNRCQIAMEELGARIFFCLHNLSSLQFTCQRSDFESHSPCF